MKDLSELTILSAENFTNIELRKRLEKMEVKINNNLKRKDLTKLYNDEVLKSEKIIFIQDSIEKDLEEMDKNTANILENPFKKSKISSSVENNNRLKEKRDQYKSQKNSEANNSGDKNKLLNEHLKVNEKFINEYLKNMGEPKTEINKNHTNGTNGTNESKSKTKNTVFSVDSSDDTNQINNKINTKSTNLFTTTNRSKSKVQQNNVAPNNLVNKPFDTNEKLPNNIIPDRKGREETMKKIELKIRGNEKNEISKKMENDKEIKKNSSSVDKNIFTNNASSALKNMLGLGNDRTKETRDSKSISKEDVTVKEARDSKRLEDGLIGEKSIKFNLRYNNDPNDSNGASALMETINLHLQAKDKASTEVTSSTNKVLLNRSKLNEKKDESDNNRNKNLSPNNQFERNSVNVNKDRKLENNPMNNDYIFSDQFTQFKNQFAKDFENMENDNKDKSKSRFSNQERTKINMDNNFKRINEENISIHSNTNKNFNKSNNTENNVYNNNKDTIIDNKSLNSSKSKWINYLLLIGGVTTVGYLLYNYIEDHYNFLEDNHESIKQDLSGNNLNNDDEISNTDNKIKTSILFNIIKPIRIFYNGFLNIIYDPSHFLKSIMTTLGSFSLEILTNNWQYILVIVCIMILFFYIRKWYLSRSIANQAFNEIRTELRNMYNSSSMNYDDGIFEEQIVIRFSDRYNLSDEYFRTNILPIITEYRRKDPQIKVFTKKKNGVLQNVWQWI